MIAAGADRYVRLRQQLHAHPELGFEEQRTAALVAAHLQELGLKPVTGIGRTGVVASITRGSSSRSIGLRADMDALALPEGNMVAHRSTVANCSHACGHDGHTAMLLAAAERLATGARFDGTVHLIFQPAEEGLGGARAMIQSGLFDRFPCDEIYGMHNMPGLPVGAFAVRSGAFCAGADFFQTILRGRGGHAAFPHTTVDPIVAAAQLVTACQTVVSRNTSPMQAAVLTVAEIKAGTAFNVIPHTAEMRGTLRYLDPAQGALLRERLRSISEHVAAGFGATLELELRNVFPVLVNDVEATGKAVRAAADVVGAQCVNADAEPVMGSEDFAAMLERVPGCYILIGNGAGQNAPMLHSPLYDFNDAIIPLGARYWTALVEQVLAPRHT